jgi:hypothetical protein
MAEKKNLCAPISIELHVKVREEQERLGEILSEYVEQVLREHFEGRSKNMWIQQKKAQKIQEYIRHQLDEDNAGEQVTMGNF